MDAVQVTRRDVLKGTGALCVSFAVFSSEAKSAQLARRLSPAQLDSYLAIAEDGSVTAYFGKIDMGQGVDVSIAQVVAEELDVSIDVVDVVMGDSALTLDQGGASGSTAIEAGAKPLRNAAAEARRVLVDLAAAKLKLPAAELVVTNGVVHASSDPSKRVSYGELIGGKHFDVRLEWNGRMGNALDAQGAARPKSVDQYRIVGQSLPRPEVAEMILGTREYIVDVKVPGMLHARVVRPPKAGATPVTVDERSIRSIPGARVVREKDFLAVVAESEWNAIRAAQTLKVTWSQAPARFPRMEDLYDHIRKAPVTNENASSGFGPPVPVDRAPVEAVLARAARVIEAEYEFPFQSHACMAPACAVADFRGTSITVWTGSQKPHSTATGVAKLLKLPLHDVRAIWTLGPGSYGRNDAGDAAIEAALLSKATGRPVRVQGMRHEGHAWDPKAPASIHVARAGLDASGNVIAYSFFSKGFSRSDMAINESDPSDTYAGMLTGWPQKNGHSFGNPDGRYEFPVKLQYWQTIAPLLERASPLRTAHLRDPLGPQLHFASESFMDELAAAVGADPIEFRLRYIKDPRDIAVLQAVRERSNWTARPAASAATRQSSGIASGRGVAYTRRGNAIVAVVAHVEIDLNSGRVWPRKYTVASDQGIVLNPLWLRRTLEGNIVMAASRSLCEEVQFSTEMVTSTDWSSYPILDIVDAPEEIDTVVLNRPDLPPYGAGEPATRTVTPAIANAIYDAIGVRVRRVPFTPERIKKALEEAAKARVSRA